MSRALEFLEHDFASLSFDGVDEVAMYWPDGDALRSRLRRHTRARITFVPADERRSFGP